MEENKKRDETNVEPTRKSRKFLVSPKHNQLPAYKNSNKKFHSFLLFPDIPEPDLHTPLEELLKERTRVLRMLEGNHLLVKSNVIKLSNEFVLLIKKRKVQEKRKSELFLSCFKRRGNRLEFYDYISGLFPTDSNTYRFDYNGYLYKLQLGSVMATITKLGKKRVKRDCTE